MLDFGFVQDTKCISCFSLLLLIPAIVYNSDSVVDSEG